MPVYAQVPKRCVLSCVDSACDSRNLAQAFLRTHVFCEAEGKAHWCPSDNLPTAAPGGGHVRVLADRKSANKCLKKLSTSERRHRKFLMSVTRFIWDHDPVDGRRELWW